MLEDLPELTGKRGRYFCPACGSPVCLKRGKIKQAHFAHLALQDCQAWSENESSQHLALKMALYQWFRANDPVEIERYLPELEQTPDLLVRGKIAIEIQCSSLSLERLRQRTDNYLAHDFAVIWLMGRDLWLKENLTELSKNLMTFSNNRGFYFWELDLARQKLRLKSLLHEDLREKIHGLTEEFDFGQGNLLAILRRPYTSQKALKLPVAKDPDLSKFIRSQLYHKNPKWLKIQAQFYEHGQNLLDLDFDRPVMAPVGLNLLTYAFDSSVKNDFCQIKQDLREYYQNFYAHFAQKSAEKDLENVYPPAFYAIMKRKK